MTQQAQTRLILGACISPSHQGTGHGHHPLTGENIRIARRGLVRGVRIEQKIHHHDGTVSWGLYDEFIVEAPIEAMEIVLRGGRGVDYLDGARWTKFNGSSQPKLNNDGETIRVVDSQGQVLDQRVFAANSCDVLPPVPQIVVKPPVKVDPAPHYSPWKKR